jgi:enamine deaminase RidA (YjgF/YER057c/UK114 family)
MGMSVYDNLIKMGIELPSPPAKGGIYLPVRQVGNLIFTSGVGPTVNGNPAFVGKVGKDLTIEEGQAAARIVAINILSILHQYLTDLNRIRQVVKILGFVASAENFGRQPQVINAASQLFVDVFGENGQHARSAIGTSELPGNIPVEIEGIFEVS